MTTTAKTQATPGPWRFDPTWALVNGPKGEEIAAIHAAQDGTRRVHPATAHANARLIAAAPELRDMLIRTLAWIDVDETAGEGPVVLVRNIHALLARIDG